MSNITALLAQAIVLAVVPVMVGSSKAEKPDAMMAESNTTPVRGKQGDLVSG